MTMETRSKRKTNTGAAHPVIPEATGGVYCDRWTWRAMGKVQVMTTAGKQPQRQGVVRHTRSTEAALRLDTSVFPLNGGRIASP